jgi:hypothetical protein
VLILRAAEYHKTVITGAEKNTGIWTGHKLTGRWRKVHNKYCNLKFSPYIIRVIKSMRMKV